MGDITETLAVPSFEALGRPGVYMLRRDGLVVYVGQSVNVRQRLGQHIAEGTKSFDSVSMVPCAADKLTVLEQHYIEKFAPEYNACSLSKAIRSERAAGCDRASDHRHPDFILSDRQAAAMLGVDEATFARLRRSGVLPRPKRLPRQKARRYRHFDIEAFRQAQDMPT